ncbi:hypothetical protein E3P77_03124 [Wallemia ichthyophaga]|uniref:Uncharacterized protein n=1 Tax=Wallemia ichthyophaga TaxID=245174 RepID=A0A4V4LYI8_WALIC|nr:hypothetical protein E3P91_03054 [Wallemia ichthyophaga]TIA79885.1 hypothetical protein E3P98_03047 [Wallemia ichthyophaga]TIB03357.1 hypothetical protein E3P95_00543 [Wallemia ichthyophaga]TIB08742.1 hypothetical protein E3P90_03566 [Wallemia ichthyophaga]TIB10194.1 hypothetical protein E3P93_02979 [Wallemia ichthyophaga]
MPFCLISKDFIAIISSIGGIQRLLSLSYYCDFKYALEASFEALKMETEHFGLNVMLIEPGGFRTSILEEVSSRQRNPISDYDSISGALYRMLKTQIEIFFGDPKVGCMRIIALLTNTGLAKQIGNGEVPTRVALGSRSYENTIKKGEELIDNATKWKEFSFSTDYKN